MFLQISCDWEQGVAWSVITKMKCVCVCVYAVLCIFVQMVKRGLVEPCLLWLAVKQRAPLSSSICLCSVESPARRSSGAVISRLGLRADSN